MKFWKTARGKKMMKRAILVLCLVGVGFVGLSAFLIQGLTKELKASIFNPPDAVPTKIYSAPFWFRVGVGASPDELHARFKQREYRPVGSMAEVNAPGKYFLGLDSAGRIAQLSFILQDFRYPDAVKSLLMEGLESRDILKPFRLEWQDGYVMKIFLGDEEIPATMLEPVLVAQRNEGSLTARKSLSLSQIPHTLLKLIVTVEDQRFLEHGGIDPRGILRSIYVNVRSGSYVQGASTITQQLIRCTYLTRKKTVARKVKEILMAILLEMRFSKDEILEKYLNEVYFGQAGNIAIHGVAEAARFYFDKSLEDLSVAEQATLAAMVRGPIFYSPYRHLDRLKARQELVLKKMYEAGVVAELQYQEAVKEKLKFARVSIVQNSAPYFTDLVEMNLGKVFPDQEIVPGGLSVFSTLDPYWQDQAEKSAQNAVKELESRIEKRAAKSKVVEEEKILQGAFLALDPTTGAVLALVGGSSYAESNYNRVLNMRRHMGSLIKPFVYLSALMYGKDSDGNPLSAISKFSDQPFTYTYDKQSWTPKNYEGDFRGSMRMREALVTSVNTVAARVAIDTGLDKVAEVANAAGIEAELKPLPSLALGAVEVNPMEVATAYMTLSNFGKRNQIYSLNFVVGEDGKLLYRHEMLAPQEVLPAAETANVVQMMTSTFSLGTARPARDRGFLTAAAGKTGTTNDFRDAWFGGFTKKMLAVAWVGFDKDDDTVKKYRKWIRLTGAVGALPMWTDFMKQVHKSQVDRDFSIPDGLLQTIKVELDSGLKANYHCTGSGVVEEVFTARNAPVKECE